MASNDRGDGFGMTYDPREILRHPLPILCSQFRILSHLLLFPPCPCPPIPSIPDIGGAATGAASSKPGKLGVEDTAGTFGTSGALGTTGLGIFGSAGATFGGGAGLGGPADGGGAISIPAIPPLFGLLSFGFGASAGFGILSAGFGTVPSFGFSTSIPAIPSSVLAGFGASGITAGGGGGGRYGPC